MRTLRARVSLLRPDYSVPILAALCLAVAAVYVHWVLRPARTATALEGRVALWVPPGWSVDREGERAILSPRTLRPFAPRITVRRVGQTAGDDAVQRDVAQARIAQQRAAEGTAYRVLDAEDRRALGGGDTTWTHYALVREPPNNAGEDVLPVVVRGVGIFVQADGGLYYVDAWAPATEDGGLDPALRAALDRMVIEP